MVRVDNKSLYYCSKKLWDNWFIFSGVFEESKVLHKHTFALKFLEISSCVYNCGMKSLKFFPSQSDTFIPNFSKSVMGKYKKSAEMMMKWPASDLTSYFCILWRVWRQIFNVILPQLLSRMNKMLLYLHKETISFYDSKFVSTYVGAYRGDLLFPYIFE